MEASHARSISVRSGGGAMVAMLGIAIFLHALDRGNFATAAPVIKDALTLSNTEIGLLLSAFYWTYVPGHILSGWLIERINAYRTLALGLATWSLATLLTGFAGGFVALFILRLLLGLGESAGFPASSKLLAMHLPPERLGFANGLVGAGLSLGQAGGVLLAGLVLAAAGWQALFFLFGALSMLWLLPWYFVARNAAHMPRQAAVADAGPSYRELLARREMWGAMLGHFCGNYTYFLVTSWLPLFLVKEQGYSIEAMAWFGGALYLLTALFNPIAGRIADRAIAGGASTNRVRKFFSGGACAIALFCMLACAFGDSEVAVASLLLFSLSPGIGSTGVFSAGQTLAGPVAAGKWIALQSGVAGLSGVIGLLLTGILIDVTGSYQSAFLFAAAVAALGVASWTMIIPRIEPIDWRRGDVGA